ncbi:hypothetical protein Tco_0820478 [Tanacetum coccineum]|uniref:Uncharacterized protein n=1 Tax=Tanacetum coccineum TaxID=301880 RepID=A0ABQ5ADU0_9ASTR
MIVDIEDDIMDPVMQCTSSFQPFPGFSQKKLVSFVTEIHTLSIDILPLWRLLILNRTPNVKITCWTPQVPQVVTKSPTLYLGDLARTLSDYLSIHSEDGKSA